MKIDIINTNGDKTGKSIDLPENIFGIEPNDHALYLAVKQYANNQRQGTHKAKEKGEITGSTRKLKKQKGTGTARAGSIKSGVFRGGGRMFGPRPRNYSIKLNKKVKALAKRSALATKFKQDNIMVIEDFTMDAIKTNDFVNILGNIGVRDQKSLLVMGNFDKNTFLSSRNLPKNNSTVVEDLNVYSILHSNKLLLTVSAVEKIRESLA